MGGTGGGRSRQPRKRSAPRGRNSSRTSKPGSSRIPRFESTGSSSGRWRNSRRDAAFGSSAKSTSPRRAHSALGWKDGPRSSAKKLERLRAFFRFGMKRKWTTENPAGELKAPRITLCPTLPYTREEMVKILAATDEYLNEMPKHGKANGRRIRGLVLLLRYSGMRISDAVNLRASQIKGNRLFLYTQKTGVPVNAILPEFVVKALETTPKVNDECYFWSGTGKLDSACGVGRRDSAKSSNSQASPTDILTVFEIRTRSSCYSPAFLLNASRLCSVIAASASLRFIMRLGCAPDRINSKLISPMHGVEIPFYYFKRRVHARDTESLAALTELFSTGKNGARGGSRTHMRKNPRRILSPQRLPFRHPGRGTTNLSNRRSSCNTSNCVIRRLDAKRQRSCEQTQIPRTYVMQGMAHSSVDRGVRFGFRHISTTAERGCTA